MGTKVEEIRIAAGTFMLMWFTNPDGLPNPDDGRIENGISTQFFSSLKDAEESAKYLSGSKVILQGVQNGAGESNVFWWAVKVYGNSFDISNIKVLSEDMILKLQSI